MNDRKLAEDVIKGVGGKANVVSVTHCATRLRFELADESLADDERIKNTEKVMGVMRAGGQYQVIIGNTVKDVYKDIQKVLGVSSVEAEADEVRDKLDSIKAKNKEKLINRLSRALMNMIYPLVPTMAAVGVLKGCLAIFVTAGVLNTTDGTYVILSAANDGFLYFLPIIIAFSVAKYVGSNPYVGAVIGASLVLPAIVTAMGEGGLDRKSVV